jgi:hypothetical protein
VKNASVTANGEPEPTNWKPGTHGPANPAKTRLATDLSNPPTTKTRGTRSANAGTHEPTNPRTDELSNRRTLEPTNSRTDELSNRRTFEPIVAVDTQQHAATKMNIVVENDSVMRFMTAGREQAASPW